MDKTMTVHTKVLVKPTLGRRIFIKLLWVSVIFLGITAVASFFASGFKLRELFEFVLPTVILAKFLSLQSSVPHYENCLADIEFADEELKVNYDSDKKTACKSLSVPYADIQTVEYSKSLNCFKLTFNRKVSGASNDSYHLLYAEEAVSDDFIEAMERKTGLHTDKTE